MKFSFRLLTAVKMNKLLFTFIFLFLYFTFNFILFFIMFVQGVNIRHRARELVELASDTDRIREERDKVP